MIFGEDVQRSSHVNPFFTSLCHFQKFRFYWKDSPTLNGNFWKISGENTKLSSDISIGIASLVIEILIFKVYRNLHFIWAPGHICDVTATFWYGNQTVNITIGVRDIFCGGRGRWAVLLNCVWGAASRSCSYGHDYSILCWIEFVDSFLSRLIKFRRDFVVTMACVCPCGVCPSVPFACEQHICRTVWVTMTKFGMKLEGHGFSIWLDFQHQIS